MDVNKKIGGPTLSVKVRHRYDMLRGQTSEVGSRRSDIGNQKGPGIVDHATEHLANLLTKGHHFMMLLQCDVAAVFGEI